MLPETTLCSLFIRYFVLLKQITLFSYRMNESDSPLYNLSTYRWFCLFCEYFWQNSMFIAEIGYFGPFWSPNGPYIGR